MNESKKRKINLWLKKGGDYILNKYPKYIIKKLIFKALKANGIQVVHKCFFDTLKIPPLNKQLFDLKCEEKRINVRNYTDGYIGISLDETTKSNF